MLWRDHVLKEEAALNAKLAELKKEGDDKHIIPCKAIGSAESARCNTLPDMSSMYGYRYLTHTIPEG